jgi:general secretion pathway protein K
MTRREDGFALVAVLLVLAILGIVAAEFAFSMRLEASAVRAYKDGVTGTHLAEAAVEQAIREIAAEYAYVVGCQDDDPVRFYAPDRTALPVLPRKDVPLGGGTFEYAITDEEGRLNLNSAQPDRLDRLLREHGIDKSDRDTIIASIQDWRDPNDNYRLNGAESEDYYLKRPVPYRARNANLESVQELLQVKGITEALFRGTDERPGLVRDVTVRTQGNVNINTARKKVLAAMGLADAQIGQIVSSRCEGPIQPTSISAYGVRGVITTSRTFRIEARGLVDGRVSSHMTVVVRKQQDRSGGAMAIMEWIVHR